MTQLQTQLWPRISRSIAETIFQNEVAEGEVPPHSTSHGQMTFGPTGGRIRDREIEKFRAVVLDIAKRHGFGTNPQAGDAGPEFDRAVAPTLTDHMKLTWEEAGQSGVWSMVALILLPDVTHWRWANKSGSSATKERWICIDPTRHSWGRLWWQETLGKESPGLLEKFHESELNQFFERTSFTRHREFFIYFMEATSRYLPRMNRRTLVRDVTKRMRRRLAFTDTFSLTEPELKGFVDEVLQETVTALK